MGPDTLAGLESATRRIANDYLTAAPLALYAQTVTLSDRMFRLLLGHQSPARSAEHAGVTDAA